MKAKSQKTGNKNKKCRMAKFSSASEAIGLLEKNQDTFILTFGQFSLIDALAAVCDQTGPADIVISTWTAAHAHLDRAKEIISSMDILSFRMIVDGSFRTRQPKYYRHMTDLFGVESVREIKTHAKFITVRNDKWDIVIKTSMNLNENPRLENIEITDNKCLSDFFEKITEDIFREIPAGHAGQHYPELASSLDNTKFQLVKGCHIKRSNTNEPRVTHETRDARGTTRRLEL